MFLFGEGRQGLSGLGSHLAVVSLTPGGVRDHSLQGLFGVVPGIDEHGSTVNKASPLPAIFFLGSAFGILTMCASLYAYRDS